MPEVSSPQFSLEGKRFWELRTPIERAKLLESFSTIAIEESAGRIVSIAGSVEPIPGVIRDFIIRVPARYPYVSPTAHSVGWKISGPHKYSDTEMCLWRKSQWSKTQTLAFAVAKAFTFIHKHEVFLAEGVWPGNEQAH